MSIPEFVAVAERLIRQWNPTRVVVFLNRGHMLGHLAARQYRLNPYRALAAGWLKWLYGQQRFAVKPQSFAGIFIILPPQPFLNTVLVTVWVLMLVLLSPTETSPFIYFQF